jgi:hypothetical protein
VTNVETLEFTGIFTIFWVGYFGTDLYRNRIKRLSHFEVIVAVTGLDSSPNVLAIKHEVSHEWGNRDESCRWGKLRKLCRGDRPNDRRRMDRGVLQPSEDTLDEWIFHPRSI